MEEGGMSSDIWLVSDFLFCFISKVTGHHIADQT